VDVNFNPWAQLAIGLWTLFQTSVNCSSKTFTRSSDAFHLAMKKFGQVSSASICLSRYSREKQQSVKLGEQWQIFPQLDERFRHCKIFEQFPLLDVCARLRSYSSRSSPWAASSMSPRLAK
jgi:hypothetical protein